MSVQPIVVSELVKEYSGRGRKITALKGVSFSVNEGEIVGILGPNGAGKTTLCLILSGLLEPTKGTAYIMGEDIRKLRRKACEKYIALYLSEYTQWSLNPRIPALKYLVMVGAIDCIKGDLKKKAETALKKVGLWEWRNEWPSRFSTGMKRRLLLAAMLMYDFPILILDEPTVHLDPASCIEVWKAIKAIASEEGRTVLLTTQNMEEAEYLCDRIIFLHKGSIIASGSPEYFKTLVSKYEEISLKVSPLKPEFKKALEKLDGVLRVRSEDTTLILEAQKNTVEPATLIDLASQFNVKILSMSYERPSLSEVFRILLKGGGKWD